MFKIRWRFHNESFANYILSEWSKNIIKVLWCRIHKCLGRFNMLTAKWCSGTEIFREWSDQVLTVCNLGNTLRITIIFFSEMFKIWSRFHKWNEKLRKIFRFYNNCLWIGNCKWSQSGTEYLSSAVNVLTNNPRISKFNNGDIFRVIFPLSNQKIQ